MQNDSAAAISFYFGWTAGPEIGIDAAAFLLSERNRCERDEDFISTAIRLRAERWRIASWRAAIDLRKRKVQIALEKKRLTGVVARVGIVLDISGSMMKLYRNGTVQEIVERLLAVACKFDDNGTLDVWIYDNEFSRLPSVTEKDFGSYVTRHIMNNSFIHKFGRNDEPQVMEDVIRKYTKEEKDTTPVFVIFINDGGVVKATKKVIVSSAVKPIFWQFIGIGHSDFEVLRNLDEMEGRLVDNAGFIHMDRIEEVSDDELYDRLLNEFPQWLNAAREKRIIP